MQVSFRTRLLWPLATAALLAGACAKSTTEPSPSCSFSVAPGNTTFATEGGSGTVAVTAAAGCAWTAVTNASFITITQGASGSGNGTVQFAVAANTGSARTGTLTVAGSTITFMQAAASSTPALSPPTPSSPVGGQTVDTVKPMLVVTNSAVTGNVGPVTYRFEVSELDSFPDNSRTTAQDGIVEGSGGTTSWQSPHDFIAGTLHYWRARATTGTITSAYSRVETFRTPCTFALSPMSVSLGANGGTATVTVTTGSACSWSATSNAPFITISSGGSGTGNGVVTFIVAANSGAARTGTLTVAGQAVTVTQAAPTSGLLTAVFDPTLKAPICNESGIGCDSGALLNGSGTTEPNQPNTIATACSDGSGSAHSVIVDSIRISTSDGLPIARGSHVLVEASVRLTIPAARIRLFFADDALSPAWRASSSFDVPISNSGNRIVLAGTNLPAGGAALQAIRVSFSATNEFASGVCATGPNDDNDDLVFRVQ